MTKPFIDVNFDFRTDAGKGDPDKTSRTLRRYHQYLWSKSLPSGQFFGLLISPGKGYLYHNSNLGEFVLSSDTVLPTYDRHKKYSHIISQISNDEVERFERIIYTIGGMMVFPGHRIPGGMTINQARGCIRKIGDRFDLTLECIRRYYLNEASPLFADLARYRQFFDLFVDFKGYVHFFLLQDLVDENYSAIRFFTQFNNFNDSPYPPSLEEYLLYRERTIAFVNDRNARIASLNS